MGFRDNLLSRVSGKLFTIWSTGKMFDPTDQKRTCPLEDIAKSKEKKKVQKEKK